MNAKQAAVLNTPEAMEIIILEAKKLIASKFSTTVEIINCAIAQKNENVLSMMRKLTEYGVNQVAGL